MKQDCGVVCGACNGIGDGYCDASRDVLFEGRVEGFENMEFGGTGGRIGDLCRFGLRLGEVRDGEKEGAVGLKRRRGGGMLLLLLLASRVLIKLSCEVFTSLEEETPNHPILQNQVEETCAPPLYPDHGLHPSRFLAFARRPDNLSAGS